MLIYGIILYNMNHMPTYGFTLYSENHMSAYETTLHIINPYVDIPSHIVQYESYVDLWNILYKKIIYWHMRSHCAIWIIWWDIGSYCTIWSWWWLRNREGPQDFSGDVTHIPSTFIVIPLRINLSFWRDVLPTRLYQNPFKLNHWFYPRRGKCFKKNTKLSC